MPVTQNMGLMLLAPGAFIMIGLFVWLEHSLVEGKVVENLISLFVNSVFVGNILLAYFLGMCSYLSVSKNLQTSFGSGGGGHFRSRHHHPGQLAGLPLSAGARRTVLGRPSPDRPQLSQAGALYRRHCRYGAGRGDGDRSLLAGPLQRFGGVSPADYRQLRYSGDIALHGGAALQLYQRAWYSAWDRNRLVALAIVVDGHHHAKTAVCRCPQGLEGFGIRMIVTGLMAMAFMLFSGITL
jgi:Na+-transporting NADH:ubiquinone oxidoreductase subunit E